MANERTPLEVLQNKQASLSTVAESQKRRMERIGTGKYQEGQSWEYDIKIGETRIFARDSLAKVESKLENVSQKILDFSAKNENQLIEKAREYNKKFSQQSEQYRKISELYKQGYVKESVYATHTSNYAEFQELPLHDQELSRGLALLLQQPQEMASVDEPVRDTTPQVERPIKEADAQKSGDGIKVITVGGKEVVLNIDTENRKISIGENIRNVRSDMALFLLSKFIQSPSHSLTHDELVNIAKRHNSKTAPSLIVANLNWLLNGYEKITPDATVIKRESIDRKKSRYYLDTQIEADASEEKTEEEINTFLTVHEAASIGSLISTHNRVHVYFNGTPFYFELSNEMKEICTKLENRLDETGSIEPGKIHEIRESGLRKLQSILESEDVEEAIGRIGPQEDDVESLLMWIYFLNEGEMHQQMLDFLKSEPEKKYECLGGAVTNYQKIWRSSKKILSSDHGSIQEFPDHSETPPVESTPEVVEVFTQQSSEKITFEFEEESSDKTPQQPSAIEKRDPYIREILRTDMEIARSKVKMDAASIFHISTALNIDVNIIRRIQKVIKLKPVGKNKQGYSLYDSVGAAIIRYISRTDTKNISFTRREIESMKHIAIDIFVELQKEETADSEENQS